MGRPKKAIDEGTMFHMLKNSAPVRNIAKYFGVHRDTLYANYGDIVREGRKAYYEAVYARIDEVTKKYKEEQAIKEAMKKPKRRPRGFPKSLWIP